MIARTVPLWQRRLGDAVSSVDELLALLGLSPEVLGAPGPAREALRQFPLRVPLGFVARMRRGDAADPLLRQVLPVAAEMEISTGFSVDPLGEAHATPVPGVLHKYHGRALLVATGACAVHCRYCFRRHFPYEEHSPGNWQAAVEYLVGEPSIEEVILSGGDPLVLRDERLEPLVRAVARIPHVRRLRIHSRLPVVLPERVDDAFLGWFAGTRLQPVMVIHVNHAQEIDGEVRLALERLRGAGVTVLNQAVLLAGVNDSAEALEELSRALFEAGVLPYYLHLLDRVQGAAHFEVCEHRARELVEQLSRRLPGYLVPRLVREVEGAPAKVPAAVTSAGLSR